MHADKNTRFHSFWSPGHNGGVSLLNNLSMLRTGPAGAVKAILCRRIRRQVRSYVYTYIPTYNQSWYTNIQHAHCARNLRLMDDMANPAYNTDHVPPPVYQPPDGSGSKMMPPHHQDWASVPPPGPPPGHEAGESSRTMETVPLNQDDGAGRNDDNGGAAAAAQPHVQTENLGLMSRMNPFK